jgi:aryl-alcohol dehydrogenase-like predicted oxidoreductase
VSSFAVGTWAIGGQNFGPVNRQDSIAAIRAAIDGGVNLVDTAPVYGNGYAEQVVGDALADGYREKVLISTKFGLEPNIFTHIRNNAGFDDVVREVESSLTNLHTDHIDFYFVHWPDPNTPIAETMQALNMLKEMGKIRYIGVSNFSEEQIEEAQKYGVVDVQQPPYSMVNQKAKKLIEWGYEKGIDSFTYGSMGAGILSGKYREDPHFADNDIRMTFYDYFKEPKFSKIQRLLKVMDEIAEAHGKPVSQVAMNWQTQKEYVATALVGVKNPKQAEENCSAFDWSLTDEEIRVLDDKIAEEGLDQ